METEAGSAADSGPGSGRLRSAKRRLESLPTREVMVGLATVTVIAATVHAIW
ncbi:hypothetical protein [Streptomyces sp. ODS28]|uniref:hypothetical protein n=1 Tax=Streptomyces sp. ODS28 TaxID=3136688 RepID=UPI0031F0C164